MAKRRDNGGGTLYRRNGVYYAKFVKDGKVKRRSLNTSDRGEALKSLQALASVEAIPDERVRADVVCRVYASKNTFSRLDQMLDAYRKTGAYMGLSDSSKHAVKYCFGKFLRWAESRGIVRVNQLTGEAAAAFVEEMRKDHTESTVGVYCWRFMKMWRVLDIMVNPWKEIRIVRGESHLKRAFTVEEVKLLLKNLEGGWRGMVLVALYTGLRLSDCASLKWSSIDFEARSIALTPLKTKRTSGRSVWIPLHPELESWLKAQERKHDVYVFPEMIAHPAGYLSAVFGRVMAYAGLESEYVEVNGRRRSALSFHSFRSTFISWMAESGASLALVQSIVGHVSADMTQRYYRRDEDVARQALARLPGVVDAGQRE